MEVELERADRSSLPSDRDGRTFSSEEQAGPVGNRELAFTGRAGGPPNENRIEDRVQEAPAIFEAEVVPDAGKVRLDLNRSTLLLGLGQFLSQALYGSVTLLDGAEEGIGFAAAEGIGKAAVESRFQLGFGRRQGLGEVGHRIVSRLAPSGRPLGELE
jgi:hypothetical protein